MRFFLGHPLQPLYQLLSVRNPSWVPLLMSGIYSQFHFCYFVCLRNGCVKAPRKYTSRLQDTTFPSAAPKRQLRSCRAERCSGRRQNRRWGTPSVLVRHCRAEQNRRGDVSVPPRRKRGDATGKWALESGSPLTHQCVCLGDSGFLQRWGETPPGGFGPSLRRPVLSAPAAERCGEKDGSALCTGPAIPGFEL